jgi:hypothetical protein
MASPLYKRLPAQLLATPLEGILGGLGSATEGVLGLANTGINYLRGEGAQGNILPERLPFLNLQEARNVTNDIFGKENLTPGSFPEEVLQSVGRNLPLTIATGGSNIPLSIARDVIGSTAQTATEKLGLPKAVQFLSGIGAEKGFRKVLEKAGKSKAPKYLAEMSSEAKNKFYENAKEAGDKFKYKSHDLEKKLESIGDKILSDKSINQADKTKFVDDISSYITDFKNGISGRQVIDERTTLNKIISKTKDPDLKNYYMSIRKPIIEEIKKIESKYPNFGKNLKDADALHDAENFGSLFKDSLMEYPVIKKQLSNPLAYGLATIGPKLFFSTDPLSTIGIALGGAGLAKVTQKATEFLGFIRKEAPRKLLLEASENVMKRNFPAAARSYNKLNQLADKYQKDESNIQKQQQNKIDKSRVGFVKVGNINQQ